MSSRTGGVVAGVVMGVVSCAFLATGCAGKRNMVEGTVRDEKSAPVDCRIVLYKHDSGELCNHTHEGMPCKLEKTDLSTDVKNGMFRIESVPPIDRKSMAYAAVVVTGTNTAPDTLFIFPDNPTPPHQGFSLQFANKGAVVNIVVKPVQPKAKPAVEAKPSEAEAKPAE